LQGCIIYNVYIFEQQMHPRFNDAMTSPLERVPGSLLTV